MLPVGGGSLPGFELDSWVLALRSPEGAEPLATRLREADVPILSRVRDSLLLIDLRTVEESEISLLREGIWHSLH